jgi:sugar phosphate isomerase/epimerase
LCATAEDFLRTFVDVGSQSLGLLVDVGHLKVTANALGFSRHEFLDTVGGHVVAFHLSDNDGMDDQNLPFGDDAWFLPRLNEFPKATMILEAYRLDHEQIRSCCETIKRARHRPRVM